VALEVISATTVLVWITLTLPLPLTLTLALALALALALPLALALALALARPSPSPSPSPNPNPSPSPSPSPNPNQVLVWIKVGPEFGKVTFAFQMGLLLSFTPLLVYVQVKVIVSRATVSRAIVSIAPRLRASTAP